MIVPGNVGKCVAFLGFRMADGQFLLAGTAFFVGEESAAGTCEKVYAVTARHVVDGIKKTGIEQIGFRVNLQAGTAAWYPSPTSKWITHPTDSSIDVAILQITGIPLDWDHLVISNSLFINDDVMKNNEVAVGDEVFITGLFRHHHGVKRNIPIVRIGNLACMNEEIVNLSIGPMDAYLIEARSIGGLSGSPVFLNLGINRMIDGRVLSRVGSPAFFLFWMIHGHYDTEALRIDGSDPNLSVMASPFCSGGPTCCAP